MQYRNEDGLQFLFTDIFVCIVYISAFCHRADLVRRFSTARSDDANKDLYRLGYVVYV